MRTPINNKSGSRQFSFARGLASAAVILSLSACGADTLEDLLANGEDVNVDLSLNDEGNLVVSLNDDNDAAPEDTGDADGLVQDDDTGDAGGALFDEAVDGEISGDATNPLALDLGNGSNVLAGSVVGGDLDYVTVHVPAGHVLSAIDLVSYESVDDQSFIGIQQGTVFTEPPVNTEVGNLLGFTLMGDALVGTDILPAIGTGDGAQGFTPPLDAGDYTFWIQETGPDASSYTLDLVVSPVDSAPAAGSVTVTLTNTAENQPMTPPIVVLHNAPDADNGMRLFDLGQPALEPVIAIAENGNNGPMVDLLGYLTDQGRASAFGVGFADPANPGPLLPGMSASVTLDLAAADYWVPPCGSPENITDDENGSITVHPGQNGSENPAFDFEAGTRYLEVTITRN